MAELIKVSGPQAVTFLQGQLSQDVAGLNVGETSPSFLLEPTGKVTAWLQVRRTAEDAVELIVDDGSGDAVVTRLQRFKMRTKADIEHLGAQPDATTEVERILAGLPRIGAELVPGETIPAEAGQHVIDASVSFTKGCYTGQELVARIDSRGGKVPRQIRRVTVSGTDLPPVGAEVEVDGTVVGRLTSVAWSEQHTAAVALASVVRAVEPPVAATVVWAGTRVPAEIGPASSGPATGGQ